MTDLYSEYKIRHYEYRHTGAYICMDPNAIVPNPRRGRLIVETVPEEPVAPVSVPEVNVAVPVVESVLPASQPEEVTVVAPVATQHSAYRPGTLHNSLKAKMGLVADTAAEEPVMAIEAPAPVETVAATVPDMAEVAEELPTASVAENTPLVEAPVSEVSDPVIVVEPAAPPVQSAIPEPEPIVEKPDVAAVVPSWMQTSVAPVPVSPGVDTPAPKVVEEKSLAEMLPKLPNLADMNTLVMNAPAFITLAVVLTAFAFFIGRFTSGGGKAVEAASPTPQAITLTGGGTTGGGGGAPVVGSPDEIVTKVRNEFATATEMSKAKDITDAQKQQISQTIVKVMDELTQGIKSYPDVASLYFERAQVEKMVMQSAPTLKTQALADYQKALELSPLTAEYYVGFGDYQQVIGNSNDAITNLQKAVQLDPKNADALYALAKLQSTQGMKQDAVASYAQLLTLIPQSSTSYAAIAKEKSDLEATMTSVAPPTDLNTQSAATNSAVTAVATPTPVATSSATPQP